MKINSKQLVPEIPVSSQRIILLLLSMVLLVIAVQSAAATPSPQIGAPPPISQRVKYLGQTGGIVTDFVMQDDLLFIPEGDALTILQRDPGEQVLARISPNQGHIQGIAAANETAFLITPIGLAAIDVQDPHKPQLLSFLPGGGEAVEVHNDFAFVPARAAGLRVINVTDPSRPVLAITFPLPGKALAIALDRSTNLAYVAADEGGLRVIDINAPDLPREVTSMEPPNGVQQLELAGQTLFLSSGDRILAVDVSRPENLITLSSYAPPRQARRAKFSGNFAYVADLDGGLKVFDLSDLAQPRLIYGETEGSSYDVMVVGNRAYMADGANGVRILNINHPAAPTMIAHIPVQGLAQGLDFWDGLLVVAAGESGIFTLNVSDERAPAVLGQFNTAGDARDVQTDGNYAYIADGPEGLAIVSLADWTAPQLRSTFYIPGEAQALGINGTFLYIAADDGGLQIIDAIRPAAPFFLGALSVPEGQRVVDIALIQKRAYLAIQDQSGEEPGLAISDVGFRNNPTILSRVPGPAVGVAVRGTDPIIVGGSELLTVDARASSGPVLMAHYRPLSGAGGMAWADRVLHLTSGNLGPELTLLDVSDINRPRELHNRGLTAGGGQVTVQDGYTYLAAGRFGLRAIHTASCPPECAELEERIIYDPMDTLIRLFSFPNETDRVYGAGEEGWSITQVQNPHLPQPLVRVQTDTPVHGIVRSSHRLYAASVSKGLLIYHISEASEKPQLLGRWPANTALQDLLIHDNYLYLIDQSNLMVVDPNPPENPTLLQTLPLPGSPRQIVPLDPERSGNLAYVLTGSEGLRLIDLGHPTIGIEPLGQAPVEAATVQVAFPHAYTLDGGRFTSWAIGDGTLEELASFKINGVTLLLDGDRAYVGSDAGHISVVDISHPANPRVLGMMGNSAAVRGLAMHPDGEHLVVGLETFPLPDEPTDPPTQGKIRVWNVSNPLQPQETSQFDVPLPFAAAVPTAGGQILVTAGRSLDLFDISRPLTITQIASTVLPAPATSLLVIDDQALVGTRQGLLILAGLTANAPYLVGEFPLNGAVLSVMVHAQRAFLAVENMGGLVLDIADQSNPHQIAALPSPTGGPLQGLSLAGDHIWAIWEGRLSWLDVSQPQAGPAEIGAFVSTGAPATDLVVVGDHAYLTTLDTGLQVLDISNPAEPVTIGNLATPGRTHALAVSDDGQRAFLADGECGTRVINLTDPNSPAEIGYWHTGFALDVTTSDNRIYVADIGELVALEFDPEGRAVSPPTPQSPQPADGESLYPIRQTLDDPVRITLNWCPPATQCDSVTYDLYLGTDDPPPLIASDLLAPTFQVEGMERRQSYQWQVVVRDRQGDETAGPLWQFHIQTQARPPAAPTLAPPPQLPPPQHNQVRPLIGGLAVTGLLFGLLWWFIEKRKA